MGSVHITEIIMVPCCLLHIPQVFSNKKNNQSLPETNWKVIAIFAFNSTLIDKYKCILLIKTNIKNWCNSFKIAKGKWKKILFLSILNSTNKGNWSILLLLSNNARGYKHHLQYCQNATVSLLYGFRSIYKTETKKKNPKHSRQNNFLATCSHQRQAALRADNKKQIQNRFDGTSHWARWTLKHRWSLQLLNGFPPPNSGWIYRMVYIKLIKSKSSVSGAVMHWGV